MMSYVSLAKYSLKDDPGIGQSWQLPASVTASIDWTPPALDSVVDDNPRTNHAICLSDEPLDSNDCYYQFGQGDVTEMMMSNTDRDAWQSIAGYRPQANTIADCVAEHLLRAPGQERVNPLTCGFNRGLEVHLGGKIWDHTLARLSEPLALPVLQIEAEGLAKIFREQGEIPYRLAMGAHRKKYDTRPVKELIQYLFPSGRDDLPLLDELTPQTVITETWPSAGVSDNSWTSSAGTWEIRAGYLEHTSSAINEFYGLTNPFPNSDRDASTVIKTSSPAGIGISSRMSSLTSSASLYFAYRFSGSLDQIFIRNASTNTSLYTAGSASVVDDALSLRSVGSSHIMSRNGSDISGGGITNTTLATGIYAGFFSAFAGGKWGQSIFDDLISGGGVGSWYYFAQQQVACR